MAERRMAGVWYRGWPFALLCLLGGSVWMMADQWPGVGTTLGSAAVGCLAAAVVFGVVGWRGRVAVDWAGAAVGGALVLAGPLVALFVGASALDAGSLTIALALTPVVVAVADAGLGEGELTGETLWPGMTAAVGLLLLLPVPSIASVGNDVAMLLAPVLTGVGCVVYRRSAGAGAWKAAVGLTGAVLVFGVGMLAESLWRRGFATISWMSVGMAAVVCGLGMLALTRLTAGQYAARFTAAPLVILLEGVVLLHSVVTWRVAACGLLLLMVSVALLRAGSEAEGL